MEWSSCGHANVDEVSCMENNECCITLLNKATHDAVDSIKIYEAEIHFVTG
jgi:hypothetical protein